MKITFIGAGSLVFGKNLLTDLLLFPSLQEDTIICLEDIHAERLELMFRYIKKFKEDYFDDKNITIEKTTNQRKAIQDAKYIIDSIHVGGLDAFKLDVEIPFKYGVNQTVGDTIGPGGVFRFLRATNALKSILQDMQEVGHNADNDGIKPFLFNYANPMAMNTWYCNSIVPDSTVGLCHGVQGTAEILRNWAGVKREEFSFFCAGINHMAWFLEVWYKDSADPNAKWQDAYPLIYKALEENPNRGENEKVRIDMMKAAGGYFMTEESRHLSEYLPYYRKIPDFVTKFQGNTSGMIEQAADYLNQVKLQGKFEKRLIRAIKRQKLPYKKVPTGEYAPFIINAMETNVPFRFNGNVMNKESGLITNLPKGCCVEVPVFADNHGLHPQGGIVLPTICQALCSSNIMVQKAAVEGVLEKNREKIYHAILLDPNTASVCSTTQIYDMVEEMFEAEEKWIPKF
ncbi:MAG: alpha-glucosidase/alpha-galactosidase [Candidatus Lokiarchaeota archaeon]|nr:alpha-glucosidase/alpha-galactosidase [Candidatus Lokiarchaeota archaeon]